MDLAFCLGYRRWVPDHLRRCLYSIRAMAPEAPIALAALDETGEDLPLLGPLASEYRVQLVWAPQPEWSRAYALNRAAEAVAAPYVVFTDADMVFPEAWVAEAAPRCHPETLWLTRARDFSMETTYALPVDGPVPAALRALSTLHSDVGQGGGMVVPRAWFLEVGGFDEFYKVWGAEDNDLVQRALWAGLLVEWLPEEVAVCHQWHRRDWPTPAQWEQVRRNRAYFYDRVRANGPTIRNR